MRSGIMLCYPYSENRLLGWKAEFAMQPKLNGERCRAVVDEVGHVTLLSSEGRIKTSVPHIEAAIAQMSLRGVELDGELYIHGKALQDIHSIVSREVDLHPDFESVNYHIFDIVSPLTQRERFDTLYGTISRSVRSTNIRLVPVEVGFTPDAVDRCLSRVIGEGYEGIVIRKLDAHYERKRSTSIMKFKPRAEDIYEIVGFNEEISIHGESKGSLGALVCKGDDSTIFRVGSGPALTRDARQFLWEVRDTLPGKYARVKYQTHSKGGVPMHSILVEVLDTPFG